MTYQAKSYSETSDNGSHFQTLGKTTTSHVNLGIADDLPISVICSWLGQTASLNLETRRIVILASLGLRIGRGDHALIVRDLDLDTASGSDCLVGLVG